MNTKFGTRVIGRDASGSIAEILISTGDGRFYRSTYAYGKLWTVAELSSVGIFVR